MIRLSCFPQMMIRKSLLKPCSLKWKQRGYRFLKRKLTDQLKKKKPQLLKPASFRKRIPQLLTMTRLIDLKYRKKCRSRTLQGK